MKIRPVGADLFHADGQTDRMKLIVAFLNSANAPKNEGLKRSWDFDKDRLAWLSQDRKGNFILAPRQLSD